MTIWLQMVSNDDVTKPHVDSYGCLGRALSQFTSFGSSSKHAEIGPESFGVVVCRAVGTVPGIWGLVWRRFRPKSGSKWKMSGRILQSVRALSSSAEGRSQAGSSLLLLLTALGGRNQRTPSTWS